MRGEGLGTLTGLAFSFQSDAANAPNYFKKLAD